MFIFISSGFQDSLNGMNSKPGTSSSKQTRTSLFDANEEVDVNCILNKFNKHQTKIFDVTLGLHINSHR